jgi:hypothetical protein
MDDRTLVMVMVDGIGASLTNDEKRAHLADLRREHPSLEWLADSFRTASLAR